MACDEGRGRLALRKRGMPQAGDQEALVGGDAEGDRLFEARDQPAPRLLAGRAEADELGDHRVVERRNLRTRLQRVLDAERLRHLPQRHPAGLRHEILVRVLGAQPHLDGVAGKRNVLLPQRQRLAGRDAQLPLDQVEPGDRLGHRMLDLQPRVHFHEIEMAALRRAGTRACRRPRSRSPSTAATATAPIFARSVRRDRRRGRLLDQLLMPPLHRAVALAEMDGVAEASPNTWISMWRGSAIARSRITVPSPNAAARLGARAAQRIGKRGGIGDQPHAATAAAGDRLDHHRKADRLGLARA